MAKLSTKFFKAMAPGFEKTLAIPVAFNRSLEGMKLDRALIKSCQGSWNVKVRRVDGILYFGEGWKDFVKHHILKEGDFVFFHHQGNMVFFARVCEFSGCEKEFPTNCRMMTSLEVQRDCKGERPLDAAMPGTSKNRLHFWTLIKPSHVVDKKAYVTIPVTFVKSSGLGDRSRMTLIVPSGKKWEVELGRWQGGPKDKAEYHSRRTTIKTKGWLAFYKENELKLGYLLKFVLRNRKMPKSEWEPVLMDVEIYRRPAP